MFRATFSAELCIPKNISNKFSSILAIHSIKNGIGIWRSAPISRDIYMWRGSLHVVIGSCVVTTTLSLCWETREFGSAGHQPWRASLRGTQREQCVPGIKAQNSGHKAHRIVSCKRKMVRSTAHKVHIISALLYLEYFDKYWPPREEQEVDEKVIQWVTDREPWT